ncbi:unnamed protein product [Parajaminaea phylloscopi]
MLAKASAPPHHHHHHHHHHHFPQQQPQQQQHHSAYPRNYSHSEWEHSGSASSAAAVSRPPSPPPPAPYPLSPRQESTGVDTMPFSRPGQPTDAHAHYQHGHTSVPPPMAHPHAVHLGHEASFSHPYHYGAGGHSSVNSGGVSSWAYPATYGASIYGHAPSSSPSGAPVHDPAFSAGEPSAHAHSHELSHRSISASEFSSPSSITPLRTRQAPANKKKRSRSPSQAGEQGAALHPKRPAGLEKRNSNAGAAKTIEKDGQTTTVFQCRGFGDCNMTFTRSEHLARHIRKHTGERPFRCHCGKSFSRLDNLRQHAQTVHADETDRNEAMMQELTNLHASLAASAAQAQHAQAIVVPKQDGGGNTSPSASSRKGSSSSSGRQIRPAAKERKGSKHQILHAGESVAATSIDAAGPMGPMALSSNDRAGALRKSLPSAHLGGPLSPSEPAYSYPQFASTTLAYRNSDSAFAYNSSVPHDEFASMHASTHVPHSPTEIGTSFPDYPAAGPRASYPFDATVDGMHAAPPYPTRSTSLYGRDVNVSSAHADWMSAHDAPSSRRNSMNPPGLESQALPGLPPPPPTFGNLFSDQHMGFQRTLSANQVRTSTLAKAHPLSPSLPPSSHGRPPTADRPILPPLTATGGSASRPGTSSGAPSAFLAPLSPTQAPLSRPGSSHGEGWFRPPTASGDLGRAFRFQRRNSMLDLPEIGLDSRPATSNAMPPPEGGSLHSRSGAAYSRGGTGASVGSTAEKLRPLSSSGRLGSSGGVFGENYRPTSNGAFRHTALERDEVRTSPTAHSPFRFQPPPLSRSGLPNGSPAGSSSAAASFFKDRPLTSHASQKGHRKQRQVGANSDRLTRFQIAERDDDDDNDDGSENGDADESRGNGLSGAGDAPIAVLKKRPFTSGDLPPPRFGSRPSSKGNSADARDEEGQTESIAPSVRPDSSRRVSIASLIGQE